MAELRAAYFKVGDRQYKRAYHQPGFPVGRQTEHRDIIITDHRLGNSDNYSPASWFVSVDGSDEVICYGYATLKQAKQVVEHYLLEVQA